MTTRTNAFIWLRKYFPNDFENTTFVSKYHVPTESWFFTLPTSLFDKGANEDINILCQSNKDETSYYFIKVPASFFIQYKQYLCIRKGGNKFDLHLSAKQKDFLTDKRSAGQIINLKRLLQ